MKCTRNTGQTGGAWWKEPVQSRSSSWPLTTDEMTHHSGVAARLSRSISESHVTPTMFEFQNKLHYLAEFTPFCKQGFPAINKNDGFTFAIGYS